MRYRVDWASDGGIGRALWQIMFSGAISITISRIGNRSSSNTSSGSSSLSCQPQLWSSISSSLASCSGESRWIYGLGGQRAANEMKRQQNSRIAPLWAAVAEMPFSISIFASAARGETFPRSLKLVVFRRGLHFSALRNPMCAL